MKSVGAFGEKLASRYLKSKGYEVLGWNWTCRWGEIDLVTRFDDVLVFVEVKYRGSTGFGGPYSALSPKKLRSLHKAIDLYLAKIEKTDAVWRLDAVCLTKKPGKVEIEHFENILV